MQDGEYEAYVNHSPTGASATVYLHKELCKRPPTQTVSVPDRPRR
ncbi:hypothetical protein [Streptomyces regalis]|nr:hypothetical protein [Streptomyces regalis]